MGFNLATWIALSMSNQIRGDSQRHSVKKQWDFDQLGIQNPTNPSSKDLAVDQIPHLPFTN